MLVKKNKLYFILLRLENISSAILIDKLLWIGKFAEFCEINFSEWARFFARQTFAKKKGQIHESLSHSQKLFQFVQTRLYPTWSSGNKQIESENQNEDFSIIDHFMMDYNDCLKLPYHSCCSSFSSLLFIVVQTWLYPSWSTGNKRVESENRMKILL